MTQGSMSDEQTLAPCPYCGTEPHMDGAGEKHWVECNSPKCWANGPMRGSPSAAIAAWNTRTQAATDRAEIERLTDMADVGEALMQRLKDFAEHSSIKGWHPAQCPTEIVGDLLNEVDEGEATIERLTRERDEARENWSLCIETPAMPGGFVGDIWFGHPVKSTMGTHRWDGAQWIKLPLEADALVDLLAKARASLAEARVSREDASYKIAALQTQAALADARAEAAEAQRDALSAQVETMTAALRRVRPWFSQTATMGIHMREIVDAALSGTAEPQEPCRTCNDTKEVLVGGVSPAWCPTCQGGDHG